VNPEHDSGYKLLFAHPEMVRDLITGFVPGQWREEIDFATLERVNASFVAESGKARHDDMIWRVRLRNRSWLYLYLLLEFQSRPDRFMALRLLVYVGLLYQDLVKRGELTATGQLPPVLPIVLYNGTTPWREAESLAELIAAPPQGLEAYLPQLRYLLIDENRYDETTLASQRNLAAALFRLEQSRTPEQLRAVLKSLIAWLSEPEQKELRRSLTIWIARLLRRKIRSEEIATVTDLLEIDTMLAERIESWTQQWMLQGLQKGKAEGEALALKRLLAKRFGPLPAALEARIAAASLEEIEAWFDAAITAPSLDAVFGSNPQ